MSDKIKVLLVAAEERRERYSRRATLLEWLYLALFMSAAALLIFGGVVYLLYGYDHRPFFTASAALWTVGYVVFVLYVVYDVRASEAARQALGLGALVEELFFAHRDNELIQPYRRLHEVRQRMLQVVEEKERENVAEIVNNIATAIKRYAPEIEGALAELRRLGADPVKVSLESVVEEYAEVLRLDVPVGGDKTLEDLLYESRDEVLDKLHEVMMALFMEYVEINETCGRGCPPETVQKLEELAALELASYVVYRLFQKQKIDRRTATTAFNEIVDRILS